MTRTQVFITNVKAAMKQDGIKLEDLAEKTGIHANDLSRLLNQRVGSCKMDKADVICQAIGLPWEDLTSEKFSEIVLAQA